MVPAPIAQRAAELAEERARSLLGRALLCHGAGLARIADVLERRAVGQLVAAEHWRRVAARGVPA